ncbi:pseudouridine-5'-phosphate glycosidase [Pseudonocardia hispaniensis]|uniref:Pseudouridine-5'-phosphate glycosidase n=1 Tax=Pseudonocardia hispaniensis TaxID=904933 RepID=A0ABW1J2V2_9PSEU
MPYVPRSVPSPVTSPALAPEVAAALAEGRALVALESTLLAHGLPAPLNRSAADALEAAVRAHGAVPATIAVLDGQPRVGLDATQLDRVCAGHLDKLSVRDLGAAVGLGRSGATTVAATVTLAAAAGIEVLATGGLGGVHRDGGTNRGSWDISADLPALARTPVLVVCSGVKSVLDVAATLEVLETESVPVLGYRTDAFPGFYRRDSGHPVPCRVDTPEQVAAVWRAHRALGSGLVLAQPVPAASELDGALHDRLLAEGLALVAERGVTGKDVTPALLRHFHTGSGGASQAANLALVSANAELAAKVARQLAL